MTNALKIKKEILRALQNEPSLVGKQLSIGFPGSETEAESIFISAARNNESARSLGLAHRREEITIELAIVSEVLGVDLVESEERAWKMFAGVEQAIAKDSSLNGIALMAEVTGFDQRSFNGPERNVVEIMVDIKVVANKDLEI